MKFKDFLEMFDDWNRTVVVNDDNLERIVSDKGYIVWESHQELYERKVIAFGFYDNELCIRIK